MLNKIINYVVNKAKEASKKASTSSSSSSSSSSKKSSGSSSSSSSSSSSNIYSGMTSAQKENERKYLNNLVSGGGGNAEWAKQQLQQLDASGSSTPTTNTSTNNTTKTNTANPYNISSNYSASKPSSGSTPSTTAQTEEKVSSSEKNKQDVLTNIAKSIYGLGNSAVNIYKDIKSQYEQTQEEETEKEIIPQETVKPDNYYELYEEYNRQMDDMLEKQKEAQALATEQGVQRLKAQKDNVYQGFDDASRQEYVNYMQGQKVLPEQMADQGLTGGMVESSQIALRSDYENRVNNINIEREKAVKDIDDAIEELKRTGDLEVANLIMKNAESSANAYLTLAGQQMQIDSAKAEEEKQRVLNTLGQYYNDYQARINYLEANPNDPEYWTLPYLKMLRQEKVQSLAEAEEKALEKLKTEEKEALEQALKLSEDEYDRAMKQWETIGYVTSDIAEILGIPEGTKTSDYQKLLYDINKPYTTKNSSGGKTNAQNVANKVLEMMNKTEKVKLGDWEYYQPVYDEKQLISYIVNNTSTAEEADYIYELTGLKKYMQ